MRLFAHGSGPCLILSYCMGVTLGTSVLGHILGEVCVYSEV